MFIAGLWLRAYSIMVGDGDGDECQGVCMRRVIACGEHSYHVSGRPVTLALSPGTGRGDKCKSIGARLFVCSLLVACVVGGACAQDLTHRAVPQKWMEPLLRDDLPPLALPDYIN